MRGRGRYSFTSPKGEESARHFFSTIHQVQTGPSSHLPKPLPGVHAQWDLEVRVDSLEVCLQGSGR